MRRAGYSAAGSTLTRRPARKRIALSARTHHFGDSPLPFLCECDDKECHELITLSLSQYDGYRDMYLYLVATGHRFAGGTCVAR